MSLLSFLLFLRDSHFQLSKNASHTPRFINIISGHKPCRTILNVFLFFLKLISIRVPDRASILQGWMHHTFISYFLHILGAGEKSLPQETKASISFSANIADMRIPFQIICNCCTKVFYIIHIFENCTLLGIGSLNFIQMFSCQLHHVAFDRLESHAPFPSSIS